MRKVRVDCEQKCLLIHRKKKTLSNVPCSFFKVMIGSDFSTLLYLPPKFGPTASTLVNKEAIIEDSSGQQWTVKISVINNSYAFQEGWDVFSLEHGLEVGHFLVFNYIGTSHFVVKVFDKSGCEKIDFSNQGKQNSNKKRKTMTIDLDSTDELLNRQGLSLSSESDAGKMQSRDEVVGVNNNAEINEEDTSENSNSNNRSRIQSLYQDKNYEDPCCSKDRDFGGKERGNTGTMFDVFRYEMFSSNNRRRMQSLYQDKIYEDPCCSKGQEFGDKESKNTTTMFDVFWYETLNNSGVHRTGKFGSSNEMFVTRIYNENPMLEEMMLGNGATQEDPFEVELTKRSNFLEELDKSTLSCETKIPENLSIACAMNHEEIKENNNFIAPNLEDQKCKFAENSETEKLSISKEGYPLHAGNCENAKEMIAGFHVAMDAAPMCQGEMERMIQKELLNTTSDVLRCNDQLESIVGDQGSNLNSIKAEPSDYGRIDNASAARAVRRSSRMRKPTWKLRENAGVAHMFASISETNREDNVSGGTPSGSREERI